jgi:hypothetical protein
VIRSRDHVARVLAAERAQVVRVGVELSRSRMRAQTRSAPATSLLVVRRPRAEQRVDVVLAGDARAEGGESAENRSRFRSSSASATRAPSSSAGGVPGARPREPPR